MFLWISRFCDGAKYQKPWLWVASFTLYKLVTKNLQMATIFLQLVAKRRPEDFSNFERWSSFSMDSRRKKERAHERETWKGRRSACPEGPRKSSAAPNLITWQLLCDLSKILTENEWSRSKKHAVKKCCTFYPGCKYICHKDQLGYLTIERWSNKPMVNTQL